MQEAECYSKTRLSAKKFNKCNNAHRLIYYHRLNIDTINYT